MIFRYLLVLFVIMFDVSYSNAQQPESEVIYSDNEVPEEVINDFVDETEFTRKKTANPTCVLLSDEGKYGIQVNGEIILPLEYQLKKYIRDSVYVFKKDSLEGIFDAINLKWIVPIDQVNIKYAPDRLFIITRDSLSSLIDRNGNVYISKANQVIEYAFFEGYFIVKKDTNEGIRKGLFSIEKNDFILDILYENIVVNSNDNLSARTFRIKNQSGYRLYNPIENKWGKNTYDEILDCTRSKESRVIVKLNGLYGVIDENENTIISIQYESIKELKSGRCIVFAATNKNNKVDVYEINGRCSLKGIDGIKKSSFRLKILDKQKYGLAHLINDSLIILLEPEYDEIQSFYGCTIIRKEEKYNVFCQRKTFALRNSTVLNMELPYSNVQRLYDRKILTTQNGFVSVFDIIKCEVGEPTEFTQIEDVKLNFPGPEIARYLKVRKVDGKFYLATPDLKLKSQEPFYDILSNQNHYIFFINENGKIGVYHAMSNAFILEPIYDSIEYVAKEIFLFKDGKKGVFKNGEVLY